MRTVSRLVLAGALILALAVNGGSALAEPTCAGTLDIAVHGQHIVGDYVAGVGSANLGWPPTGVGDAIAGEGASVPGGPGPGFHFPNGFAPGASFCLTQSNSPGAHPGP
jgi:hypothetical protein